MKCYIHPMYSSTMKATKKFSGNKNTKCLFPADLHYKKCYDKFFILKENDIKWNLQSVRSNEEYFLVHM